MKGWWQKATAPLRNEEGEWSGVKLILVSACLLAALWLLRDLCLGQPLSEWHTALLGVLLVIGLVNRISARGYLRVRLGRDGAEFETRGGGNDTDRV